VQGFVSKPCTSKLQEGRLTVYRLPYGKTHIEFSLPERPGWTVELLAPRETPGAPDPVAEVQNALDRAPLPAKPGSAVIAINDKTRPVPHKHLLPPLLKRLEEQGRAPEDITLLIATGTHVPMPPEDFPLILPPEIIERYPVYSHDSRDDANLIYVGETKAGTPVRVNRRWRDAGLRIVVGNIEPHQFMGFSGGVKSAAIGVTAQDTINTNHAFMAVAGSEINRYEDNPCRQDVEEIGRMIGVDYALNAILNEDKQIVHVLTGSPVDVMLAGIPLLRRIYQFEVPEPYDLMIVSAGGHPKDINLYQGQKALGHASLVTREGGTVILAIACPEGTGSRGYEEFILAPGMTSHEAVLERYHREGYRIGPHKAWQISRDASRMRVIFLSDMAPDFVRRLLLEPAADIDEALALALRTLPHTARIGIMPIANATIPILTRAVQAQ
jgi:lactate racemase